MSTATPVLRRSGGCNDAMVSTRTPGTPGNPGNPSSSPGSPGPAAAFTYADPRACPSCRSPLPEEPERCPRCDVALGHPVAVQLFRALQRVDSLSLQLRAVSRLPVAAPPAAPSWAPAPRPGQAARPLPPLPQAGPSPSGVKGSSVPAILLGLGALCLLVAAVIFLAVAWSWLGVGGRTAALVVLTAATAGGGLLLHARGLRLAAESLLTVSAGLLVLDVLGADHAGWFGTLSGEGLAVLVGLALAGAGAAVVAADRELAVPQVAAVTGLYVTQAALSGLTDHPMLVAASATAGLVGLLAAARSAGLGVVLVASSVAAALTWLQLLAAALLAVDPERVTVAGLLDVGTTPGLLAASVLLLAPLVLTGNADLRALCLVAAGTGVTATLALPVVDNGLTALAVTSLVAGLLWTAVAHLVPRRAVALPMVPAALSLLPALGVAAGLAGEALESLWSPTADLRLDPSPTAEPVLLLASVLALVGLALAPATPATRRSAAPVAALAIALAAVATLALYPVPLLVVVLLLCAVGGGIVGLRHPPRRRRGRRGPGRVARRRPGARARSDGRSAEHADAAAPPGSAGRRCGGHDAVGAVRGRSRARRARPAPAPRAAGHDSVGRRGPRPRPPRRPRAGRAGGAGDGPAARRGRGHGVRRRRGRRDHRRRARPRPADVPVAPPHPGRRAAHAPRDGARLAAPGLVGRRGPAGDGHLGAPGRPRRRRSRALHAAGGPAARDGRRRSAPARPCGPDPHHAAARPGARDRALVPRGLPGRPGLGPRPRARASPAWCSCSSASTCAGARRCSWAPASGPR